MTLRLGRRVNHDERSRAFPAPTAPTVRSVLWRRWSPILEQGNLGSCTGNAMVGILGTQGVYRSGTAWTLTEDLAVSIYERATVIDPFDGAYPPDDTGSDAVSACKAAKERGLVSRYTHAFGLDHTLAALALSPVMLGCAWYEGMFNPQPNGVVEISGNVAGGHEFVLSGIDVKRKVVRARNSWGTSWGLNGMFYLSWATLDRLLQEDGDVTVPAR